MSGNLSLELMTSPLGVLETFVVEQFEHAVREPLEFIQLGLARAYSETFCFSLQFLYTRAHADGSS